MKPTKKIRHKKQCIKFKWHGKDYWFEWYSHSPNEYSLFHAQSLMDVSDGVLKTACNQWLAFAPFYADMDIHEFLKKTLKNITVQGWYV